MYHTEASEALLEQCRRNDVVIPDYGGYCIENVPGTAAGVLDVDVGTSLPDDAVADADLDVSHVVVIVLDGLGWHRFHRDATDHRCFEQVIERGSTTPLTSVLPSSTSAAIPTFHTGTTPAEHGVLGWDVRLPDHDVIVEPFLHEIRDAPDDGATPPVPASAVVQSDPIYPMLESVGIETRVVQPAATLGTAYANATFRGATQLPYDEVADGVSALGTKLEDGDGPSYSYVYVSDLDATSHRFGTSAREYHDALDEVHDAIVRGLIDDLDAKVAEDTLLVLTADHGMRDFAPGPEGCLDVFSIPAVADAVERSRSGAPVFPWGDYRALHLAIEDGERRRACEALEARGVVVFDRETVIEEGFYGQSTSTVLAQRCGDLICTHPDRKLVYPGSEGVVPYVGMHGGPTPQELLVPFAAAKLSRLRGES